MTMRRNMVELIARLERSGDKVAKLVAGTSLVFSFIAFREFMAGADQHPAVTIFVAALAAAACGGILYFLYAAILGGIPAVDRLSRRRFIPLIGVLMVGVSLFSTYPHVVVTAGNEAIRLHAARLLDGLSSTRAAIQGVALSVGELGPVLSERGRRLEALAECEMAVGCQSGAPNRGDLSDALTSAAGKISSAGATLQLARAAIDALIPQLDSAFERGDELAVRTLLADMRGKVPLTAMQATAADLRTDLGIKGSARNATLRERQNEAIARTQRDLGDIAAMLDEAASRVNARLDAIVLPDRRYVTKARAIVMYAPSLVPQIALGVAIDLILIVAAFLIAMLRDAIPPSEDDASDITLADARRIRRELSKLLLEAKAGESLSVDLPELKEVDFPESPFDGQGIKEAAA
jgi:hypothetical protein